jgi:hypothetical protein
MIDSVVSLYADALTLKIADATEPFSNIVIFVGQ